MKNSTLQQYDYHQWANNRFFEHLKALPDKVYEEEIQSVFSSILEVIIHIYQVDAMWLSVMSGNSFEETMAKIGQINKRSSNKDLNQMQQLYADLVEEYHTFFENVNDFHENITIEHPQYGSLKTSVSELVDHVVNHGTYHRGNITAMLRQQGQSGVPSDYIFYLYERA